MISWKIPVALLSVCILATAEEGQIETVDEEILQDISWRAGYVSDLSPAAFPENQHQAYPGSSLPRRREMGFLSNLWVIRFKLGWVFDEKGQSLAETQAFLEASQLLSPSIVRFGEFTVESEDDMALIDCLGLGDEGTTTGSSAGGSKRREDEFPLVGIYGMEDSRKGVVQSVLRRNQTTRPSSYLLQYKDSLNNLDRFKRAVLGGISDHYFSVDPLSFASSPSVNDYPHYYTGPRQNVRVPALHHVRFIDQVDQIGPGGLPMQDLVEKEWRGQANRQHVIVFFGVYKKVEHLAFLKSQGHVLRGEPLSLAMSEEPELAKHFETTLGGMSDSNPGLNAVVLSRTPFSAFSSSFRITEKRESLSTIEKLGDFILEMVDILSTPNVGN